MYGWLHEWMCVFHCCLSLAVSINFLPLSPVHFKMLSIQAVLGLPFLLSPPTSPVIRLFSMLSLCCLIMCPKYRSFLIFTCLSYCYLYMLTFSNLFIHSILIVFVSPIFLQSQFPISFVLF